MMVAKRRGETIPKRKQPTRVGPVTVNRTVTQPLREIMIRAREIWNVPISKVKWRDHLLAEPQERM